MQVKRAVAVGMRKGRLDEHYHHLDSRKKYRLLMFCVMEEIDKLPRMAESEVVKPWWKFW